MQHIKSYLVFLCELRKRRNLTQFNSLVLFCFVLFCFSLFSSSVAHSSGYELSFVRSFFHNSIIPSFWFILTTYFEGIHVRGQNAGTGQVGSLRVELYDLWINLDIYHVDLYKHFPFVLEVGKGFKGRFWHLDITHSHLKTWTSTSTCTLTQWKVNHIFIEL